MRQPQVNYRLSYLKCERERKQLATEIRRLEELKWVNNEKRFKTALEAIAGPADSGPWIEVYRKAGGGYEGLQAIARQALSKGEKN